ncbi:MAG: hypothetical protein MHPDNHAH_02114 [Anaerolineales bacterium]|nr:hypothetical protein [Anaerolineales bacterium]
MHPTGLPGWGFYIEPVLIGIQNLQYFTRR